MARISVDVDDTSVIWSLNMRDPKVLERVLEKLVDSWDYSQELHTQYAERLTMELKKRLQMERDRIARYGGSIGDNLEFCEKEIRAGRRVDSSKLRYTSN